ncbi:hypothetical protein L1987_82050 [Smallanthus sonchifolius]|uniref:Uncharacterized protein n=1 Tax=Smallanthus sonchifolius TaxID=185202 RepID=A0ACB8YT88_9ASTR|nr:hypothetical protein L1987_82050 [Smallanthus sonchifolius]
MDATMMVAFFFLFIVVCFVLQIHRKKPATTKINLPPGSFGWPFIGETLEFARSQTNGTPEKFVRERIERDGSPLVFKTSLLSHRMAVFLRSCREQVFVRKREQSGGVVDVGSSQTVVRRGDEAKWLRKLMLPYLTPDAYSNHYSVAMDIVTRLQIKNQWEGRSEVKVFDTVKLYLFELACRMFLSLNDPKHVAELGSLFNTFLKGLGSLPINIPGTKFYRCKRAAFTIKKQLIMIINQRKLALKQQKASSFEDLLSHLLLSSDEHGRFLSETEIANNILLLLFAGHESLVVSLTLLMKSLGEHPNVYKNVLKATWHFGGKKPGEVLKWDDIQKMRYSWNVVCEVFRLNPPAIGAFQEALVDFEYAGYTIPKGWKIFWSTAMTHKEEANFPDATKFDPSRFEGAGPAPFTYIRRKKPATNNNLPPGSFGWPILGETLEFLRSQKDGAPEKFVRERIERYGSPLVFKTSLLGHRMAVFCGPEGNKFLFGNENKVVASWWPETIRTLFGKCLNTSRGDEAKWLRKMMLQYLAPDALSNRYSVAMDIVTRRHIQNQWEGIISKRFLVPFFLTSK